MDDVEAHGEIQESVIKGRKPWLGAFLNFFCFPGVGYFYSRQFRKGIIFLLLAAAGVAALFVLLFYEKIPLWRVVSGVFAYNFALKLYVTLNVFKSIKKQNSIEYEFARKTQKDPWAAIFLSFLWPGLGHLYLRRGISFVILSLLNIGVFLGIQFADNIVLSSLLLHLGYKVFYCGLIAVHCYWVSSLGDRQGHPMREVYYSVACRGGCQLVLVIYVLVYVFYIAQLYSVPSVSMEPTILAGDKVFVSKIAYWNESPQPGDMVVFQKDSQPAPFIKRVVAVGGQTVQVNDRGVLIVDDKEVMYDDITCHIDEKVLGVLRNRRFLPNGKYQVPDGCYYVIGDNYSQSYDSRDFGPLKKEEIIGEAIRVIPQSANRW